MAHAKDYNFFADYLRKEYDKVGRADFSSEPFSVKFLIAMRAYEDFSEQHRTPTPSTDGVA